MVNRFWDKENKYSKSVLKEYNHWVIEVSYRQHTLGSFIIFCKREGIEKISELNQDEFIELGKVMKEIENALSDIDVFRPDRFNYLQMGNKLHGLHFHGIPRYSEPRMFNDQKWVDKSYGNVPIWSKNDVDHDIVEKIKETIKPHLYSN